MRVYKHLLKIQDNCGPSDLFLVNDMCDDYKEPSPQELWCDNSPSQWVNKELSHHFDPVELEMLLWDNIDALKKLIRSSEKAWVNKWIALI